ncbi:carbamoyltransferase N-terminal domain-containing protein [Candidatus Pseudothioglobus singularis]|uniref:carbamoyltransferase N-terminal domain-containing protein n=1 Tax=Candidatus Pseudothioglobus singularis TaxID=1427364 RepID=UPI002688C576
MKIMGTKYCGHDSALCLIDTEEKTIFAMSTERVTRIKHDYLDITPILEEYMFDYVDFVSHSYNDFEDKGNDGELREKMTYNKDIEKAIRLIVKPKYIKDLRITRSRKNKLIFKSLFRNFKAVRMYYFAKIQRALISETTLGNKIAFTNYIKRNFSLFKLYPKEVFYFDHHLCHAIPSYCLSPFSEKKAIALTIDGQGDGFFSKLYLFNSANDYELIGHSEANLIGDGDRFSSIGRIYNYFTQAMDLHPNSDEGKVEALAAFGVADQKLLNELKNTTKIDSTNLCINYDAKKLNLFFDINFFKK